MTKRNTKRTRPLPLDIAEEFVAAYLANGRNAARAYRAIRPQVSENSAWTGGWKMLKMRIVQDLLKAQQLERIKRFNMDADEAAYLVAIAARADVAGAFDERGNLMPVWQWPEELRLNIKSFDADGKVQMVDPLKARLAILQMAGRLNNKVDVTMQFDLARYLVEKADV